MNIYLLQTETITPKHFDSLFLALQVSETPINIVADYELPDFGLSHVTTTVLSRDGVIAHIAEQTEAVLIAHSETVFTVESLVEVAGAYAHYSQDDKIMIQLITPNELFKQVTPSLVFYGGHRMWQTGTRLYTNDKYIPVAFGEPRIIVNSLNQVVGKQEFTDKIFFGGETVLLTAFPSLAYNMQFELPYHVSGQAFDAAAYIDAIPEMTKTQETEQTTS